VSDLIKIIVVVASVGIVGVMRFCCKDKVREAQMEQVIEEIVEFETGIDILPKQL
jgi:hypothetical protein